MAWGEYCPKCAGRRRRRASRLARRIALLATLVMVMVFALRGPLTQSTRWGLAVGALATYLLTHLIVMRVAMEFLRD